MAADGIMKSIDFERLTHAIDRLVYQVNQLRLEKQELQHAYEMVLRERDVMVGKNEAARHKIEQMLSKLESLEDSV